MQDSVDHLCSNQVEAEVIVHSELSDAAKDNAEEAVGKWNSSFTPRGPLLSENTYSPLRKQIPPGQQVTVGKVSHSATSIPSIKSVANHNGELEARGVQLSSDLERPKDTGLANGFHSPKDMCSKLRSDQLENRDSRQCPLAPGKVISGGLPPTPFVNSGLVHSTSAAHSYLCP